ncbi:MAG: Asp-tRNA(Asn)/Glu-tRNA(Gln) amidotransferase subunit GatB [Terriglobia bacterium]
MPTAMEVRSRHEVVIGLEVHVQLLTRSKIFCGCSTRFGDPPNTHTCPVCLGLPGALPVLNREAVTMAMKAAMALNCSINPSSRFARKNYFYPDLPKGYQISQYDEPLAENGWLETEADGRRKRIGITRVHLEEDAGKSLHEGFPDSAHHSYIDLNRSGVPLIEIVTEPDLRSPEEAHDFLTRLKTLMLYLEVSDCNMEEGSLRCDANASMRPTGATGLGTKTEVKNLNSFRFLQRALAYETERQMKLLECGGEVKQETRLWDSREQRTYSMRSKEFAHDYRYFPEPDLLPVRVSEKWKEEVRSTLRELPQASRDRFLRQYALPKQDAELLVLSREMAGYFEEVAKLSGEPKLSANWILNDLTFTLEESGRAFAENPVLPADMAALVSLVAQGTISGKMAKEILGEMVRTGKAPAQVIVEKDFEQIEDPEKIRAAAGEIIHAHPKQVEQYRGGKTATLGWFVGQVMKATRGQANPQLVRDILQEELVKE